MASFMSDKPHPKPDPVATGARGTPWWFQPDAPEGAEMMAAPSDEPVTRAEFDALKREVDRLRDRVGSDQMAAALTAQERGMSRC